VKALLLSVVNCTGGVAAALLITRRVGTEPKLAVEDALRVLVGHAWERRHGGVLAYYPVARGNPFQALIYSALDSVGVTPVPTYDLPTTVQFARLLSGSDVSLGVHIHWLTPVLAGAEDEADALRRAKEYLEQLRELVDLGGRIVWTVHNILPHDTRFPDVDAKLCQGVVDAAERVHVMSPRTLELVSSWYEIPPSKVVHVPHPAYHGVYPSHISQARARAELGIPPHVITFVMFGLLAPYKGLTELLDAYDTLCLRAPGRYALIVAGAPTDDEETQAACERLLTHPSAYAALRKVPVDEVQLYLRSADIAVFPYRRSLNSGALALALTFGLPVVLRDNAGDTATVDETFAVTYDGAGDGLVTALERAAERLVGPYARAQAAAAADRVAPALVAGRFAEAMNEWLSSKVTSS